MLYIDYLNNNRWTTLSLRPQCQYDNSYFLFRAIDKDTKKEYLFISSDDSPNPEYYSLFFIISATYSDPMNGIIDATPGQYTLEVYEKTITDLDYTTAVGKINVNILNIVGTHSDITTWSNTGQPTVVYKNLDRI